jgi:hypothetical protein
VSTQPGDAWTRVGRYDGRSRAACEPRQRKAGSTAVRGGPGPFANQVSAFARTHGWVRCSQIRGFPDRRGVSRRRVSLSTSPVRTRNPRDQHPCPSCFPAAAGGRTEGYRGSLCPSCDRLPVLDMPRPFGLMRSVVGDSRSGSQPRRRHNQARSGQGVGPVCPHGAGYPPNVGRRVTPALSKDRLIVFAPKPRCSAMTRVVCPSS